MQVQGDRVRVCWQDSPSPGVTGYRVYRATLPSSEYDLVAEVVSQSIRLDVVDSSGGNTGLVEFAIYGTPVE